MRLTVRLLGPEARAAAAREIRVEVAQLPIPCADLRRAIAQAEPRLTEGLRTARLAVNSEFAADDQLIREGDEVALIGSVSGG